MGKLKHKFFSKVKNFLNTQNNSTDSSSSTNNNNNQTDNTNQSNDSDSLPNSPPTDSATTIENGKQTKKRRNSISVFLSSITSNNNNKSNNSSNNSAPTSPTTSEDQEALAIEQLRVAISQNDQSFIGTENSQQQQNNNSLTPVSPTVGTSSTNYSYNGTPTTAMNNNNNSVSTSSGSDTESADLSSSGKEVKKARRKSITKVLATALKKHVTKLGRKNSTTEDDKNKNGAKRKNPHRKKNGAKNDDYDDDDEYDEDDEDDDEDDEEFYRDNMNGLASSPNGNKGNSPHQTPINYAELTVEQVLDLNNIVEMCRDTNDWKLVQYLSRFDVIERLVSYVVVDYASASSFMTQGGASLAQDSEVKRFIAMQDAKDSQQVLTASNGKVLTIGNSPRPLGEYDEYADNENGSDMIRNNYYLMNMLSDQTDSTHMLKLRLKYPTTASDILCSVLGQRCILPQLFNDYQLAGQSTDVQDSQTSSATPTLDQQEHHTSSDHEGDVDPSRNLSSSSAPSPTSPLACSLSAEQDGKKKRRKKKKVSDFEIQQQQRTNQLQELLFGFVNQKDLPLHLIRPFNQLLIHIIKMNSEVTRHFMCFLYDYKDGHVLKQFVKHVHTTDDICELLILCLLYQTKASSFILNDGVSDIHFKPSDIALEEARIAVKYNVVGLLYSYITNIRYSENISAILSTIVTLPTSSLLYRYLVGRGELIVSMIDQMFGLYKSDGGEADIDTQTVCGEVIDFFCTLILHAHITDPSVQAILSSLPALSALLIASDQNMNDPIDDMVRPRALGVFRLKLVELFVILFKHYPVLTGPVEFVKSRGMEMTEEQRLLHQQKQQQFQQRELSYDNDLADMLIRSCVLQHCSWLFFRYQNHNILHNLVTHLITCLLDNGLKPFTDILLGECELVYRILEAFDRNRHYIKCTRVSLGFMGHLSIIAACVDENVDMSLEPVDVQGRWGRFRIYLEQKHFLECEYRHGGTIPLPDNFHNPLL